MLTIDIINVVLTLFVKPAIAILICIYLVRVAPNSAASKHHWTLFLAACTPAVFAVTELLFPSLGLPITPLNLASLHNIHVNFNYTFYLLLGLYCVGVLCGIFYLMLGILEVRLLQNKCVPVTNKMLTELKQTLCYTLKINKSVHLLQSDNISSPIMWGVFRPSIILPPASNTWSVARASHVLCHELAHVKRNDWPVKLFLHLICCLFWFFPPVWRIAKKCRWYAELACDDYVIENLQCRAEYAQSLMDFAHEQNKLNASRSSEAAYGVAALNIIEPTLFYLRVHAVLDGSKDRSPLTRTQNIFYTFTALCVVLLLACVHCTQVNGLYKKSSVPLFSVYPVWNSHHAADNVTTPSVMSLSDLKAYFYDEISAPTQEQMRSMGAIIQEQNSHALLNETEQDTLRSLIVNSGSLFTQTKANIDINPRIDIQGYLPVKLVSPVYPRIALQKGLDARVVVYFDIGIDGKPFNISTRGNTALPAFIKTVKHAVSQSEYLPLTIDGHKIITKNAKVAFNFTLNTK